MAVLLLSVGQRAEAEPPEIALYTMDPGDDPFTIFGHVAICIAETPQSNRCYNYGTADFNKPGKLGWEVLQGDAQFWVSTWRLGRMSRIYQRQDRTIYKQVIPLSPEAAHKARATIVNDALPANRRYKYDHFYENCSTRPRDHINDAVEGRLKEASVALHPETFRDLVRRGAGHEPILAVLTELLLGRDLDHQPTQYEAMFLPHILRQAVEQELGATVEVTFVSKEPVQQGDPGTGQQILWILALVLGIPSAGVLILVKRRWAQRLGRALPVVVIGLIALLIYAMVIISPTPELRRNELVLVLVPLDLLLLTGSRVVRPYLTFRVAMLVAVALATLAGIFIQPLWPMWTLAALVLGGALVGEHRAPPGRKKRTTA